MIKCESCEEKFHPDDLTECPEINCTYEFLCSNCYDEHLGERMPE